MRIQTSQLPYIDKFYAHHKVRLMIDSSATGNMIQASIAKRNQEFPVSPSSRQIIPVNSTW